MSNIHIPEPCHAKWNKMTPTEGGRFCDACQKTVHDFTQWKTTDIEALVESSPQPICGRIKLPVPTPAFIQQFKWLTLLASVVVIIFSSCRRPIIGKMIRNPKKSVKTLSLQQNTINSSQYI